MESHSLDMEEDDFAKVYKLSYPPFVFDQSLLLSKGDGELLSPVVMAIYALGMTATTNNFSLINLDPMTSDPAKAEYTLTASIDGDIQIAYIAWNALLSVSPARICSVIVNPYFHELRDRALMQVRVKMRSERGSLSARFALYRRHDVSVLFARTQPLVLMNNNGSIIASSLQLPAAVVTTEAVRGSNDIATHVANDIQRTHEQVIEAARSYTQTRLGDLKQDCARVLRHARERENGDSLEYANYNLDSSITISMLAQHANRGSVTWRLPIGASLDIMELVTLRSDYAGFVIDLMVGIYAHPVLDPLNNEPAMQLIVSFVFIPYGAAPITLIDSSTCLYFSEEEGEPWKIPIAAASTTTKTTPETPQVSSLIPLSSFAPSSSSSHASKEKPKKKAAVVGTTTRTLRDRSAQRFKQEAPPIKEKTVNVRRHMPKPSTSAMPGSLKRRRPASINTTDYLDTVDEKMQDTTPSAAIIENEKDEEEGDGDSDMIIDDDNEPSTKYDDTHHDEEDDANNGNVGGGGGGGIGFSISTILSQFFS